MSGKIRRGTAEAWLFALAFFCAILTFGAAPAQARYAHIVIDANSGKVLDSQNADQLKYPASLTKMMTMYMLFEGMKSGRINKDTRIPISSYAAARPPTKIGFKPGQTIRVEDAILAMVTKSANDVATASGEFLGGSEERFAQMMTAKARRLGMANTTFRNASGLPNMSQVTTARDMAILSIALRQHFPQEFSYFSRRSFVFRGQTINGHNRLLGRVEGVDGIKTGHTDRAGYNLVASATEGQMRLISAVMGGRTFKGRETESKKLLTWGFRFFETVSPLKAGKEFASEPAWFGDSDRASLGVDKDVYLTIPRGRMKDLKASYVLNSSELHAPLQKNQVVGSINFQLDGKTIEQRPLVVLQEIPEGNFFGKIIDYIKLMFHHWFG